MDYLLQLKLGCLFGLLFLTLFFGLVPSKLPFLRDSAGTEAHQMCLSFISCVAGGVFLAACLLDIIPDFLTDINEELHKRQIQPLPCASTSSTSARSALAFLTARTLINALVLSKLDYCNSLLLGLPCYSFQPLEKGTR